MAFLEKNHNYRLLQAKISENKAAIAAFGVLKQLKFQKNCYHLLHLAYKLLCACAQ